MIFHLLFFKLRPEVTESGIEDMIRSSRSILLKISEVLSVRSGRAIDPKSEWPFFIALEFESLDKKRIFEDDPQFFKFQQVIVEQKTTATFQMDFETDPSKDLKYS
ncbi:Dabb family protein [Verrucomicrobiaceae bacterium 227]